MSFNLVLCRGSLFTRRVDYTPENWNILRTVFPDYMPIKESNPGFVVSIGKEPLIMGGVLWNLRSPNIDINFFDGKIDVIRKNINQPVNSENLSFICREIKDVVCKLTDALQLTSSRLAFAPTLIDKAPNASRDFARKIFKERRYKDAQLDNCNFSNVYRVERQIGEKQTKINYLATFSEEQQPVFSGNSIKLNSIFKVDVDINTFPESSVLYNKEEVVDFFDNAAEMANDFINFYISQ